MDDEYETDATQPSTQPLPPHNGVCPSDNSQDYKGVICFLHPASPAAIASVEKTQSSNTNLVHRLPVPATPGGNSTLCDKNAKEPMAIDIALKYSPGPKDRMVGFLFGRNRSRCDVVLAEQSDPNCRRISNMHFRIYVNNKGALMLEDTSTNGTWVDEKRLFKGGPNGQKRVLSPGSVIFLCPGPPEEHIRFIVRVPKPSGVGFKSISERVTPSPEPGIRPDLPVPSPAGPPPKFTPPRIVGDSAIPVVQNARQNNAAAIRRNLPFGQGLLDDQHRGKELAGAMVKDTHTMNQLLGELVWGGDKTYALASQVGKGAFATVNKAYERRTGEVVAVKTIAKRTFAIQAGTEKGGVKKEIDILEKLSHPNIVKYVTCFEDETHIHIVMEFIEYGDLNCYLNEHVRMPEYLTKEVTTQILRGIEYIHAMGISHRDLKPDNILIASDDPIVVKISDFGLAKMVSNEETFLKTFCGTMLYLAPEVFPGYAGALADGNLKRKRHPHDDDGRPTPKSKRRPYSQAVDMWSLGCVVFALLCGSPPFEGQNKDEMCQLVTKVPFDQQRLCKYVGQDNDHCVDFIGKLLQIYPERRMMEVEALRHPWLMTDTSSSSQGASELPDGISSSINLDEDELTTKNSCNIQPVARGDDNVNDDNNGSKSKESDDNMTTPKAKVDVVIDKDLNGSLAQLNVNQIFDVETSDNHDSSGTGDDGFESLVNSREEFTQGSTGLSVIDRARAHAKNPHASCQESLGVFPESGLDDKSGSDSVLVDKRCQANGVGKEPVCPLTGAESGIDNLNFKTITPSPPPAPSPSPPPPCSDVGVSKAPSTPPREGRQNPTESFDLVSFTSAAANFNFSPESLKHCSPTDTPVRVDPSRKLIARAIPTIAILRVPADDDLPSTQPVCSQPSAVTVSSNFRFPPTPWGKLAPLAGSILAEPVTLRGQIVSFGRATNCTIRPTDIRISKHHFALQIHHPDRNLQNDPTVSRLGEWYPEPNMVVSYQVLGRCGVYINGQRVESGSVGRIWDGDEILLFKDVNVTDDTVQFMGFRAELVIGDVKRDPSQSRTGPSIYVPFSSDRSRGVLMGSSNGGASTGNSMGTTGFHVPSGINSSRLLQPGFGRTRADMSSAGAGAGASTTTASMRV